MNSPTTPSTEIIDHARSSVIRLLIMMVGLTLWTGMMLAATHTGNWIGPLRHDFCGPWGCTASGNDLIGYHAFWLALIAPPTCALTALTQFHTARRIAQCASIAGCIGLVTLAAGGAIHWLLTAAPALKSYWWQRGLFVVVDTSDVPVMQVTCAGFAGLLVVSIRSRANTRPAVLDEAAS